MINILYVSIIVKFESGRRKILAKCCSRTLVAELELQLKRRVNTLCFGKNTTFYNFLPYLVTLPKFTLTS